MPLENQTTSNGNALLAEDDALIRELVSTYLEYLGYHVSEAHNGEQAIDLIESHDKRFDLLVTDLSMPKVDGSEVVRFAREDNRCERILIISGFTKDLRFVENTIDDGSEFLAKPFTFNDFKEKVSLLQEAFT